MHSLVDEINTDICTVGWLGTVIEMWQRYGRSEERWHNASWSKGREGMGEVLWRMWFCSSQTKNYHLEATTFYLNLVNWDWEKSHSFVIDPSLIFIVFIVYCLWVFIHLDPLFRKLSFSFLPLLSLRIPGFSPPKAQLIFSHRHMCLI